MTDPDPITHDRIDHYGWNSADNHSDAVNAQQLNLIGHLLVEIRDLLTDSAATIRAEGTGPRIIIGEAAAERFFNLIAEGKK